MTFITKEQIIASILCFVQEKQTWPLVANSSSPYKSLFDDILTKKKENARAFSQALLTALENRNYHPASPA